MPNAQVHPFGTVPPTELEGKKHKPNCWERFLIGEVCCPCCACWTFFILGILFTAAFMRHLRAEGDKVFSFDDQPMKSSNIVQAYYAFLEARGEMVGCGDKAHEEEQICRSDTNCVWNNVTTACDDWSPCPRPVPRPRSMAMPGRGGRATWMSFIYEAQNDGNLFDDDLLGHVKDFEERLLTTANGARSSGGDLPVGLSPWEQDWCLKNYPSNNASSSGRCAPVANLVGLFTMTAEGRVIVRNQVAEGYSNLQPLAQCMCGDTDSICSVCTEAGGVKPIPQWPAGLLSCILSASAGASAGQQQQSASSECSRGASVASQAGVTEFLEGLCLSRPSCQWSPPGTGVCSSTGFYASDWRGLVTGAEKTAVLDKMCDANQTGWWNVRRQVLSRNFDCNARRARYARTLFTPGIENPANPNAYDTFVDNYVKGGGGWYKSVRKLEAEVERASEGKLRIIVYSQATIMSQFIEILIFDSVLSITSMLLVWGYMWWTLESFFLSSCAMFEIVFSLPVTMCLWNMVLQQKIIFTQMLVIYMILGIGADDAFILYDAWLQARYAGPDIMETMETRFAFAYRKSFHAMAITTATTCGSFLIGAVSPLPGIRDFCIFAAVVVLVDWLFCVSFFASAVVVFERFFKSSTKKPGYCRGPGCCWGGVRACASTAFGDRCVDLEPEEATSPKKRGMEKFCEGPLFGFLRKWKLILIAFWSVLLICGICVAGATLRTAKKRPPVGRDDIDTIKGLEILLEEFSFRGVPDIHFVWGIDTQEPAVSWTDLTATPRYASIGPLTTPAGQVELLGLCRAADLGKDAQNTRCDEGKTCLVLGKGSAARCARNEQQWRARGMYIPDDMLCLNGRHCFMEDFADWWAATKDQCQSKTQIECSAANSGCAWSTAQAGGTAFCYSTTEPTAYAGLPEAEFLQLVTGANFSAYWDAKNDFLKAQGRTYEVEHRRSMTGWKTDGSGGLKLAWVGFNGTIPRENSVDEANAWYDRWEAFRTTHGGTLGGFQSADVYLFMVTQNEMVRAAIMGIILSLFIAFLVLMITTMNWIVSLLGLVNIMTISIIFLGLVPILGWSLGENECIFLIAVVGLSVDYTVHLLHSFNHGKGDREERAKHALAEMGISVTNSAITTLLASLILFGCGFYFFFQFGAFIFFVIGLSILTSISFLIPLLLFAGPREGQGSIPCCFARKDSA